MFLTTDQTYILAVLGQVRFLRRDQVYRLLKNRDGQKRPDQAEAALRQLVYLRKIMALEGGVYSPPYVGKAVPSPPLLEAVDIMLDLGGVVERADADCAPFRLCFTLRTGDAAQSFGVLPVPLGAEQQLPAHLEGGGTVIFCLETLEQRETIFLNVPHYFAVRDGPRHRYYKGGLGPLNITAASPKF